MKNFIDCFCGGSTEKRASFIRNAILEAIYSRHEDRYVEDFVKRLLGVGICGMNYEEGRARGKMGELGDFLLASVAADRVGLVEFFTEKKVEFSKELRRELASKIGRYSAYKTLLYLFREKHFSREDLEKVFFFASADGNIAMMTLLKESGVGNFQSVLKTFDEYGDAVSLLYTTGPRVTVGPRPWTGRKPEMVMARELLEKWAAQK